VSSRPGARIRHRDVLGREERFERARRTVGLFLGPLVLAALLLFRCPRRVPKRRDSPPVLGFVLVWWITEAVPDPGDVAARSRRLAVALGVGHRERALRRLRRPDRAALPRRLS